MHKSKRFKQLCVVLLALVCVAGYFTGKEALTVEESSANQVFESYYAALTGTMSASVHYKDFQWRNGTEPFPFLERAQWTDFDILISGCNNDDVARINGMVDTYKLGVGYTDPQEATDRVAAYWKSQGWVVRDMGSAQDQEMRQIQTVTDAGIQVVYTASVRGEAVEASSPCISGFYNAEKPQEEPVVFEGVRPTF